MLVGKSKKNNMKNNRTAWTVENLADWLAKYDAIHKAGTMRDPYSYEVWLQLVKDVALDYAEGVEK